MAARQHDHDDDDYDDGAGDGATDDGGGGGETGRIRSLDALAEAIERLEQRVERAFSGAGQPSRSSAQPPGSGSSRPTLADNADARRSEIREELANLRSQERADAERGELLTRIGKVEKSLERAPRQLRRIEQLMGWHRD